MNTNENNAYTQVLYFNRLKENEYLIMRYYCYFCVRDYEYIFPDYIHIHCNIYTCTYSSVLNCKGLIVDPVHTMLYNKCLIDLLLDIDYIHPLTI